MEMPLQMAIVTTLHMSIVMVILMVTMEMMLMDEVLPILPRMMMIMVKAMMIESLSNRDYDGYEHMKQFVISAKQWHCTCITLFGTFR